MARKNARGVRESFEDSNLYRGQIAAVALSDSMHAVSTGRVGEAERDKQEDVDRGMETQTHGCFCCHVKGVGFCCGILLPWDSGRQTKG